MKTNIVCSVFVLGVSVTIGICGCIFIRTGPLILNNLLVLEPNSLLFKFWKEIPIPLATDFYFFNWTNPEDIYNFSTKPRFEEVGPYRFWQNERKTNITWNDNGTISYQIQKFWYYDDKNPNGNLEDVIVQGDVVALCGAFILRHWNYYIRKAIFGLFSIRFLGITRPQTANELLYSGYHEPLINLAGSLPFFSHLEFPHWDKFAWLYQRNGSTEFEGILTMGTGINSTLGYIYEWNHQNKSPYFEDTCSNVGGFSGQIFPQNIRKESISIYSPDLRRRVFIKFEKEEIVDNILGYKFTIDDRTFDNGTDSPEIRCFCTGDCVPFGMLNLSSPRCGSPLFMSLPHFYKADPYYVSLVDGLEPNETKHKSYLVLEPITGLPLKADVKVQMNFLIQPVRGFELFENAPKFFLPVIWVRQSYQVEGLGFWIRVLINLPTVFKFIGIIMVLMSAASILILLIKIYRRKKLRQKILFIKEQHLLLDALTVEKSDFLRLTDKHEKT